MSSGEKKKKLPTVDEVEAWSVDEVVEHFIASELDEDLLLFLLNKNINGKKLLSLTQKDLEEDDLHLAKNEASCQALFSFIGEVAPFRFASISVELNGNHGNRGKCSNHNQSIESFCVPCDRPVCQACVSASHEGPEHKVLPIQEMASLVSGELQGLLPTLEKQADHTKEIIQVCSKALETLHQATKMHLAKIKTTKRALLEEIQRISHDAHEKVKEFEAKKEQYFEQKIEDNLSLIKDIESLTKELKDVLSLNNPNSLLQEKESKRASFVRLLGETRAHAIAQVDGMSHTDVLVHEKDLAAIVNIMKTSLYHISEYGSQPLINAIRPLDALKGIASPRIVVVGGHSSYEYLSSAEIYDSDVKNWSSLPRMGTSRDASPAIGCFKNKVFVAGGTDGGNPLNSAEALDLSSKQWVSLPPMNKKRGWTSGVFLRKEKLFFVAGGFDGRNLLSSCESFSSSSSWTLSPSFSAPRSSLSIVEYNSRPLVLGGFDSEKYLNTCEELDFETGRWALFPPFRHARGDFGAAVLDDRMIYIVGGSGLSGDLGSVEVFDGHTWCELPASLPRPRARCAAVCLGPRLVVLGGSSSSVDTYDPLLKKFLIYAIPGMSTTRELMAAVLL